MSERQGHGFSYEEYIKGKYGIESGGNYTAEWDGYLDGKPVSIKTKKKGGAVEMSDFFRNANKEEDFYLIVGFWEGEKTNIVEEYVLYINKNFWVSQFDIGLVELFRGVFDGITNSYEDDAKWKLRITEYKERWKETESIINVHFKRDHKTQKRVQCSIKNKEFYTILVRYYSVDINLNIENYMLT